MSFQPFPGDRCQHPAGHAPVGPAPMADLGWGALGRKRALLPFLTDMAKVIRVSSCAKNLGCFRWSQGSTNDPVRKAALAKKPAWATSCCLHPHTSAVGSSPRGSGHPIPISSPPAGGSQLPPGFQCVFHPKVHLINRVELELNTSSRVKYRFSILSGNQLVVRSLDRGSTKLISCAPAWQFRPNGHGVLCCTQEGKLFPLICLFQG